MFAKPLAKKPATGSSKPKNQNKPKTVSVKTGVKTSQAKKTKFETKKSLKPPPRQDAGYSLYSSDSEEQVAGALNDIETCEILLTQIRHKQKETEKQSKPKGKKKKKDGSPSPKALNENPQRTDIIPGFSSLYGTNYPYGTALFLRQLQSQDYANSPIFNSRLLSSTPDPDKHLADLSAGKLPVSTDQVTRDIPERDVSAVSSVPPSFNHLQNMANMVDIYKQLEYQKATQLHEAAARAELEKFKAFQSASVKNPQNVGGSDSQGRADVSAHLDNSQTVNLNTSEPVQGRQSDGFIGTGSLGFTLPAADSAFRPVIQGDGLYDPNAQFSGQQDSSLTAFQPYLSGDSREVLPPQAWMNSAQYQNQGQGQMNENVPVSQKNSSKESVEQETPLTGRTDFSGASKGTDYVMLPRRSDITEGQSSRSKADGEVVLEKQNGLFQIRQRNLDKNSSSNESKSEKTDSTSKGQSQSSLDEVPERDTANQMPKPSSTRSQSSKDGTFKVEGAKNDSQNLSEMTASTPRTQNLSGTGSTSTYGGKIVFIPNDSNTPNVIGYVPGLPVLSGINQPISLPITNEALGNAGQSGSILSSVVGQQGQSASQLTSQGQGQQDGSGYHSVLHPQTIAAGDIGVRKLRYLLKELKECTKVNKDVEVTRLAKEIEEAVNAIPQLALTFNLQTEVDLAIQPLRSENSQLRRKLRLLNQQIKEKDLATTEEPKDINFEILHLQTANDTLQKVLKEEKEIKTRLAAEVQYLYNEIHKMKVERSKLIAQTSEKETEQLKVKQEMTLDYQKLAHDLDLVKKDKETILNKLESVEKENHILQITLKQRDDEITRQSEIVETMKESISELLGELEQSRVGEKTWDHNNSYGLHRLMKIVEEEGAGFSKEPKERRLQRTPERRAFDFNNTDSTSSTARLTRAALAYHDRRHEPVGGRLGPDGRQGPASESELDTLVEMHLKSKAEKGRIARPCRRRTSSSSPVRQKNEVGNLRHQRTSSSPSYRRNQIRDAGGMVRGNVHSPQRENTIGQESDSEQELSPSRRQEIGKKQSPFRRVPRDGEVLSPERRARFTNMNGRAGQTANGSEISVEQSRYSVTDYFKKYHPQDSVVRPKEPQVERPLPPTGRSGRFYRDTVGQGHFNRQIDIPRSQFQTSSEIDDRTVKSSEIQANRYSRHGKFFKDDQTISAIPDDDNMSSVSMASITTANTVDDRKFRSGIANLDANIARLQQALQKTKSMLT